MNIHNSAEEDLPSPTILLHPFRHRKLHKTVCDLTCGQNT